MSTRLTILLGVLLLVGLGAWGVHWFLANHERHSREIRSEVSPQARRNPYLAAERFLDRLGVECESVSGRDRLLQPPPESGLLLINNLGPSLPLEREQELLGWIRRGGHLVVVPGQEWDEELESGGNHLLDALGVQLLVVPLTGDERESIEGAVERQAESEQAVPVRFQVPGARQRVAVDFDRDRILIDRDGQADWGGAGEELGYLLQFEMGRGRLTVLSDDRFLTNDAIDRLDHALFLAQLAQGYDKAWLLYSSKMPSLIRLLWNSAPQLLVGGLVLLLLLLWSMGMRTGPLLCRGWTPRRNLMEHLDAAARYAWRMDGARLMCVTSQQGLEQAWRRRHLILGRMNQRQRCEWIAARAGLTPGEVETALYGRPSGEKEFTDVSAVQQRLAARLRSQRGHDNEQRGSAAG
jgi:hypothetical protein